MSVCGKNDFVVKWRKWVQIVMGSINMTNLLVGFMSERTDLSHVGNVPVGLVVPSFVVSQI